MLAFVGKWILKVVKMIEKNTKTKQGDHWMCRDEDGTVWKCKREPFNNELGKWFIKLENHKDGYEDFMTKIKGSDHDI